MSGAVLIVPSLLGLWKHKISAEICDASHTSLVFSGLELAERVGFEPTLPFRVNTLSKRAPSATRPSLRRGCCWEAEIRRRSRMAGKVSFPWLPLLNSRAEGAEPQPDGNHPSLLNRGNQQT